MPRVKKACKRQGPAVHARRQARRCTASHAASIPAHHSCPSEGEHVAWLRRQAVPCLQGVAGVHADHPGAVGGHEGRGKGQGCLERGFALCGAVAQADVICGVGHTAMWGRHGSLPGAGGAWAASPGDREGKNECTGRVRHLHQPAKFMGWPTMHSPLHARTDLSSRCAGSRRSRAAGRLRAWGRHLSSTGSPPNLPG